jgi:hypothetical protein
MGAEGLQWGKRWVADHQWPRLAASKHSREGVGLD